MDTEILSRDALLEVQKEVYDVAPKWYNLGLELELTVGELEIIKVQFPGEPTSCLREMLRKWLSRGSATWKLLVKALKERTVDHSYIADQIERKKCTKLPIPMDESEAGSSKDVKKSDVQEVSDLTENAISIVGSVVDLPVQNLQQERPAMEQVFQKEQKGVHVNPNDLPVSSHSAVKRVRDDGADSELPQPKKQEKETYPKSYTSCLYEFVEAVPQDLLCQKCGQLANNPHQMKCCHKLYCESCLPRKSGNHHRLIVGTCSKESHMKYDSFPDGRSNGRIRCLKIKCVNSGDGCVWQGELGKIADHRCRKERVACEYAEIGCSVLVCRDSMTEHGIEYREKHLDLAMKTIVSMKQVTDDLQQQLVDLRQVVGDNQEEVKSEMAQYRYPPTTLCIHDPNFNDTLQSKQGKVWHTDVFYTHRQGYKVCLHFATVPKFTYTLPIFEYFIRLTTLEKPIGLPPTNSGTATIVMQMNYKEAQQPFQFHFDITLRESLMASLQVPFEELRGGWHKLPDEALPFPFTTSTDQFGRKLKRLYNNIGDRLIFKVIQIDLNH